MIMTPVVSSGESVELVSGSIAYSGYATVDGTVIRLIGGETFQTPLHSIVVAQTYGPTMGEIVNMRQIANVAGNLINPVWVLEVTGDGFFFR